MNSRIYSGRVMHERHLPATQRWTYPFIFYAIDLDELDLLDRTVKGFGYNRSRPVGIRDEDYLLEKQPMRDELTAFTEISRSDQVILITVARFLGKVFKPVSFYYIREKDGTPKCMVAEVNNTFGERHLYVMKVDGSYPVECSTAKAFHVSPFNDMRGEYCFSFSFPGDQLRIHIELIRDGQTVMDAAMWGAGEPLTSSTLWKTLLRHPFNAAAVVPRIVLQAARLYLKRLSVYKKPAPSSPMTIKA